MEPLKTPQPAPVDPDWLRDLGLRAGKVLRDAAPGHRTLRVEKKGEVDLVTEVDLRIQELLVEEIQAQHPGEEIVAEEGDDGDELVRRSGVVWYLDPLDGTTNFVHGHPFCAVSIARWVDGAPASALVHAPMLDELFVAAAGEGATLERPLAGTAPCRLQASGCEKPGEALLATGFPYHRGATARVNLAICAWALASAHGIRRAGSAALDLCHTASGRIDGYWEMGLSPWDVAAGTLIAREAGVRVTDFVGDDDLLASRRVVAASTALHDVLMTWIRNAHESCDLRALGPIPGGTIPLEGALPTELL